MMHRNHPTRFWLAMAGGTLTVVLVVAGFLLLSKPKSQTPAPEASATPPLSQLGTERLIQGQDKVRYIVYYSLCNHTRSFVEGVSPDWVGLTWQQVAERAEPWTLQDKSDTLSLEQHVDQYCPEHYILKLEQQMLAIYHNDAGWGELTRQSEHTLDTSGLDEETLQHLTEGMIFEDMDALEGFLESINS